MRRGVTATAARVGRLSAWRHAAKSSGENGGDAAA
jgi:hypothetical protein